MKNLTILSILVPAILSLGIVATCGYLAIANPQQAPSSLAIAVGALNFWAKSPLEKNEENNN
jgi:hypothetical protein